MTIIWLFLALCPALLTASIEEQRCVSGYCLPAGYQKLETPVKDHYTTVKMVTDIMDVLSVNDKEFSVTLTMYFAVQWEEPR